MEEPWVGYNQLSVKRIADVLTEPIDSPWRPRELRTIYYYEKANKNRKTLLREIIRLEVKSRIHYPLDWRPHPQGGWSLVSTKDDPWPGE